MKIVVPRPLVSGDLVRVISPSMPSLAYGGPRVQRAVELLGKFGLRVDFAPNSRAISDDGWSAGSPEERAADLMGAFMDPTVAAVVCAVGGATSHELLPLLDPFVLSANPKVFIGRSDNVVINAFLHERAGMVSYAGASFIFQLGDAVMPEETLTSFRSVLMDRGPVQFPVSVNRTAGSRDWRAAAKEAPLERPRPGHHRWLRPGWVTAPIVGAEVALLPDLLTQGLVRPEGRILWCDVGRPDFEWSEEWFGKIAKLTDLGAVAGLLIADNPWVDFEEWIGFLEELLPRLGVQADTPTLVGGDCGHYDPVWLLPYGDDLTLDSVDGVSYRTTSPRQG
jgi:muramoyltetrapeptide carboxypeptidase LdcA involved in peptidoglycan recycling